MSTAAEVAADMAAWASYTRQRVHEVVRDHGALLQSAVKRHASQPRTNPRPSATPEGPRLLTGDYNRSITRLTTRRATTTTSAVGTNKIQGPRLEFGFTGVDALGRTVNARPYPHFGPGLDEISPQFEAEIAGVLAPPDRANPTSAIRPPTVT